MNQTKTKTKTKSNDPFAGKFVIIRSDRAGVHSGTLQGRSPGDGVVLTGSRRFWKWRGNEGLALSGLARSGPNVAECKIDTLVPLVEIRDVIEIIEADESKF
jgi:hypothetical protein